MIIGKEIGTKHFDWIPELSEFVAEESDLRGRGYNALGRLYDDACDQGFVLVSHKSGAKIPVYLAETETDNEGDIVGWHFKPVDSRIDTWSITIIND